MAPAAFGHHSVAGQFDTSKPRTLKGAVSKIQWINPHVYLYIDVKEANGTVTTWALETLPTAMLRKAGISKESMGTPGEIVTVDILPARDGTAHLGYMSKITFADGHFYTLGGATQPNLAGQ